MLKRVFERLPTHSLDTVSQLTDVSCVTLFTASVLTPLLNHSQVIFSVILSFFIRVMGTSIYDNCILLFSV